MSERRDVDWAAIREDYEAGRMPLRQLAATYGVSKTYLIERRNKEQWNRPTTDHRPTTPKKPKSNTNDLNALERVRIALNLYAQRLSWDEIAARAGYANRGAAYNAVRREMQGIIPEDVKEIREQEIVILDVIHQKVWAQTIPDKKDDPVSLWGVDRLLAISLARRQLLNLDVKPEEALANQNYTKRIILTHQEPAGGDHGHANS